MSAPEHLLIGHPVLALLEVLETNPTRAFGDPAAIVLGNDFAKTSAASLREYLASLVTERDELQTALDADSNNPWRFWRDKSLKLVADNKAAEAERDALREALDHVATMAEGIIQMHDPGALAMRGREALDRTIAFATAATHELNDIADRARRALAAAPTLSVEPK